MKNKIIAAIALASASLFAFAEAPAENAVPAAPEKAKCCPKAKPACKDAKPDCKDAARPCPMVFVKHMLLSMNDEALAKLADEVAAVRAMSAEQRAEALAKLPKPQFQGAPNGKMQGKCNARPARNGKKCGEPRCKRPEGEKPQGELPPPPPAGENAPVPPVEK